MYTHIYIYIYITYIYIYVCPDGAVRLQLQVVAEVGRPQLLRGDVLHRSLVVLEL